jgi:hypothetical protein
LSKIRPRKRMGLDSVLIKMNKSLMKVSSPFGKMKLIL